jgi:hypothetical protein
VRRHRLDPFSLLFGALFVGVGLSFLLGSSLGDARRTVWPMFALLLGATFAAWAAAAVLRERRSDPEPPDRGGS